MEKYIFTKDFEATEYRGGDAHIASVPQKKSFKKGQIVTVFKHFSMDKTEHLTVIAKVGSGTNGGVDSSFDVTNAVVPYTGTSTTGFDEAYAGGAAATPPAGTAQDIIVTAYDPKNYPATYIGSGIGTIAGLGYAFNKKKGFWAYVGFMLLGSIVFGTAGRIIDYTMKKK